MMPSRSPRPAQADRRLIVYGYLRAGIEDEFAITVWRREVQEFCAEQGYRLETIFVDRRVPQRQVQRPGFSGLLDVLALRDTHGVVLMSAQHLSNDTDALLVLQGHIQAVASRMIVIHEETP